MSTQFIPYCRAASVSSCTSTASSWSRQGFQFAESQSEGQRSCWKWSQSCSTTSEHVWIPLLTCLVWVRSSTPKTLFGYIKRFTIVYGMFSMSPLPRLHHHDITTIVELHVCARTHFNTDKKKKKKKGKIPFPGPSPSPNCNTTPWPFGYKALLMTAVHCAIFNTPTLRNVL